MSKITGLYLFDNSIKTQYYSTFVPCTYDQARITSVKIAVLNTEEGTEQYQKRMCTVEPVFGQTKQDKGF